MFVDRNYFKSFCAYKLKGWKIVCIVMIVHQSDNYFKFLHLYALDVVYQTICWPNSSFLNVFNADHTLCLYYNPHVNVASLINSNICLQAITNILHFGFCCAFIMLPACASVSSHKLGMLLYIWFNTSCA